MNHYKYYKNYFENNMRIMYLLRTELVKHSRLVFIFNNSSTSKLNSNLWAWFSDFWFKPLKDAITTATLQFTLACHAMDHCWTGPTSAKILTSTCCDATPRGSILRNCPPTRRLIPPIPLYIHFHGNSKDWRKNNDSWIELE